MLLMEPIVIVEFWLDFDIYDIAFLETKPKTMSCILYFVLF